MDKTHKKINYRERELTYYEIIEKQVKMIKKSIENNEEYKSFKIKW